MAAVVCVTGWLPLQGRKWRASSSTAQALPFAWHMEPSIHTAWPLAQEPLAGEEGGGGAAGAQPALHYARLLQLSGVGAAWSQAQAQVLQPMGPMPGVVVQGGGGASA